LCPLYLDNCKALSPLYLDNCKRTQCLTII
jgi:hypothetical protein